MQKVRTTELVEKVYLVPDNVNIFNEQYIGQDGSWIGKAVEIIEEEVIKVDVIGVEQEK